MCTIRFLAKAETNKFSSGRVCGYFLCHYKDLPEKINKNQCVLWTPDTDKYHLQCISKDPSTSSLYGVTGRFALRDIPNFSVTQIFPPDVMHFVMRELFLMS